MLLALYIVIVFYWYLIKDHNEKNIKTYIYITATIIVLVCGLRNKAIYGDTLNYCIVFERVKDLSIPEIFEQFPKDPYFYSISHYLHPFIFNSYTIWLLLISSIYIIPLTYLIRKYSPNPMYSWVCFIYIGIFGFIMAGLRQTVAMGLLLLGFIYLLNGKKWHFIVSLGIASMFHGSSLIFAIVYPIVRYKLSFTNKSILIYSILIILCLMSGSHLMSYVTNVLGQSDGRYIGYGQNMTGSNYTYMLQQLLLVVPSLYFLKNNFDKPINVILAHISMIALIFVSLSPVIAEMFRVSMYFSWANILLFPIAMSQGFKKIKGLSTIYMLFFTIYLTVVNGSLTNEYFFWFENTDSFIIEKYYWLSY